MSQMTVARLMERDTYAERTKQGKEVFAHELLYPLMQGRDSVAIESDVELGGTDQTFNNLCGRDLQRNAGQPPQIVMVMPILVGTDGTKKMSKSLGNYVAITDSPSDMFGKIMRIPDEAMRSYFELLTEVPPEEIDRLTGPSAPNPRDTKEQLAKNIIAQYHPKETADAAAAEFARLHGGKGGGGLPDEMPEVTIPAEMMKGSGAVPIDLILLCGFAKSRGDARRLVAQGGIRMNGTAIEDALTPVAVANGDVVQRGKREFARLRLDS